MLSSITRNQNLEDVRSHANPLTNDILYAFFFGFKDTFDANSFFFFEQLRCKLSKDTLSAFFFFLLSKTLWILLFLGSKYILGANQVHIIT